MEIQRSDGGRIGDSQKDMQIIGNVQGNWDGLGVLKNSFYHFKYMNKEGHA